MNLLKKSNKYIFDLFCKKYDQVEEEGNEICISIEIHPDIKHFFIPKNKYEITYFLNHFFLSSKVSFQSSQKNIINPIGSLWGTPVTIIENLPFYAKFIGDEGTIITIPKSSNEIKIKQPESQIKYLEL